MKRAKPAGPSPAPTPPAKGASPGARRLRQLGTVALIALPIVAAVTLLRLRGTPAPKDTLYDRAMLDSLRAADARGDWVATLDWAERLGAKRPNDSWILRARGTAWSNYAVAQRPGRVLKRPALRTSLERSDCMKHALGLLDSAATAANSGPLWLDAMARLAECEETLGLPGDALLVYERVKQRLPDQIAPAMRAYWLRALLYDPVHPDTSAWDRHLRSIGQR